MWVIESAMSTERPRCLYCTRRLKAYAYRNHPDPALSRNGAAQYGGYGDNFVCGHECGYRWAIQNQSALDPNRFAGRGFERPAPARGRQ